MLVITTVFLKINFRNPSRTRMTHVNCNCGLLYNSSQIRNKNCSATNDLISRFFQHVAAQRFLRGGSEFREKPLVGWRFGSQGEPEEVVLGPRNRSGPPSRPADPAAADAGVTLYTDPRSDRTNRQYPPRHPDLSSGGVRHRDAGERILVVRIIN